MRQQFDIQMKPWMYPGRRSGSPKHWGVPAFQPGKKGHVGGKFCLHFCWGEPHLLVDIVGTGPLGPGTLDGENQERVVLALTGPTFCFVPFETKTEIFARFYRVSVWITKRKTKKNQHLCLLSMDTLHTSRKKNRNENFVVRGNVSVWPHIATKIKTEGAVDLDHWWRKKDQIKTCLTGSPLCKLRMVSPPTQVSSAQRCERLSRMKIKRILSDANLDV